MKFYLIDFVSLNDDIFGEVILKVMRHEVKHNEGLSTQ